MSWTALSKLQFFLKNGSINRFEERSLQSTVMAYGLPTMTLQLEVLKNKDAPNTQWNVTYLVEA